MKQEKPSTFILNRNDEQYFFVEGNYSYFEGPHYNLYYTKDEKPIFFKAENFVEIFALDEKHKIKDFTSQALLNLSILLGSSEKLDKTYKQLYDVYMCVNNSNNDKNPALNSNKKSNLIEAIEYYNEIKSKFSAGTEISYEENYRLVNDEKQFEKTNNTEEYIENSKEIEEKEEIKGIQRVLKKEAA